MSTSLQVYLTDSENLFTFTDSLTNNDSDSFSWSGYNLEIAPNREFAISHGPSKVISFDLTDPENPSVITTLPYNHFGVKKGAISVDNKFFFVYANGAIRTIGVDPTTYALSELYAYTTTTVAEEVHASKDGNFLYAKSRQNIKVYSIATSGALTELSSLQVDFDGTNPVTLEERSAISPDGTKLAVGMRPGQRMMLYGIDQATGALTEIANIPRDGDSNGSYTAIEFSDDGNYLYVSQDKTSSIDVYDISGTPSMIQTATLPGVQTNNDLLITISRDEKVLYTTPKVTSETNDEKIWKYTISETDGTLTYDSVVSWDVHFARDLATISENKILVTSISANNMSGVPANAVNIYIGTDAFQADATEVGAKPLSALPDFSAIDYVVTHTRSGADLVGLLNSLRIAVSKDEFDDFAEDQGPDRLDQVRTYQTAGGKCFDMNTLADIGSQSAVLSGNFNDSVGADPIVVDDGSADGVTIPMDISNVASHTVAAALPKALGAQMPLTNGKDEVLRIMINEADFAKLAAFSIKGVGATDRAGNTGVTLQSLLRGADGAEGDSILFANVNSDHTLSVSQRKVGHEILSALFRAYPAGHDNTNQASGTIWEHVTDDFLELKKLPETINLQFVLRTELDLKDGGSTVLSTNRSPTADSDFDADSLATNRVLILYNFVFTA